MFVVSHSQLQLPRQHRQKLHSAMMMPSRPPRRKWLEFRVIRVQLAIHGRKIQRLEVKRNVALVRPFRKALPLFARHDRSTCRCESSAKKYSSPTLYTMAIRNSVGSVGNNFPRSTFESIAAESPVCLPAPPIPFFSSAAARAICLRSRSSEFPFSATPTALDLPFNQREKPAGNFCP